MSKLFSTYKVTSKKAFEKKVNELAAQPNARLFNCYRSGHIFTIATAFKVQDFYFSSFDSGKEIARFIQTAMQILREKVEEEYLLVDE
ncbi:MAG: hypothetical protein ACTHJN_10800 [Ginsengibacter sp.]